MYEWKTFVPLLLVLGTGAVLSTQVEEGFSELGNAGYDEKRGNASERLFGIFKCDNKGCDRYGGECGQHWFSRCKRRINSLCRGICTCCVPCGGSCGANNTGTCRTSCSTSEYETENGKCGNFGCSCCERKPDCGEACGPDDSGTCKIRCDSESEVAINGVCKLPSCQCCQPKSGCDGRCGRNNSYYCRERNACNFWNWRIGNCPSKDCRCCRQ